MAARNGRPLPSAQGSHEQESLRWGAAGRVSRPVCASSADHAYHDFQLKKLAPQLAGAELVPALPQASPPVVPSPRRYTEVTFHQQFAVPAVASKDSHPACAFRTRGQHELFNHIYPSGSPHEFGASAQPSAGQLAQGPSEGPFYCGWASQPGTSPRRRAQSPRIHGVQTHFVGGELVEQTPAERLKRGGVRLGTTDVTRPELQNPALEAIDYPGRPAGGDFFDPMLHQHSPRKSPGKGANSGSQIDRFPLNHTDLTRPHLQNPTSENTNPSTSDFFDPLLVDHHSGPRYGNGPYPRASTDITLPNRNDARGATGLLSGERGFVDSMRSTGMGLGRPDVSHKLSTTDITAPYEVRIPDFCEVHASSPPAPAFCAGGMSDLHSAGVYHDYMVVSKRLPEQFHGRRTHKALQAHINSSIHP